MSFSITYNGNDLSTYGLTLKSEADALAAALDYSFIQLPDRAYASRPKFPAKSLNFEVVVKATSAAQLQTYLDAIRRICAQLTEKQLILDVISDRYWQARFTGMMGQRIAPSVWEGTLSFVADDPLSYATSETSSDFSIDADPDNIAETPGGSTYIKPIYTLTAGEALTDITLLVENIGTGEEFTWTGSIGNGKLFVINVTTWYASNDGSSAMSGLNTGNNFPRLIPGVENTIKVTGFGSLGSLNIAYRDTFL